MFKKVISLVLGLVMVLVISGVGFAYTTYKEAFDAGMLKYYKAGDYVGARTDFVAALTLTTIGTEKSDAQLHIGYSYYDEKNHTQARIEYAKVFVIVDGHPHHKSNAQLHIGHSYYFEKNYVQARIEYAKVLEIVDIHPHQKSDAQLRIGHSYYNEKNHNQAKIEYAKVLEIVDGYLPHKIEAFRKNTEIVSKETTTDWKAHAKWLNLVAISLGNTPDEQTFQKEIYSTRENICMAQFGKSYADCVKDGTIIP